MVSGMNLKYFNLNKGQMSSQKLINASFSIMLYLFMWSCNLDRNPIPFQSLLRDANVTLTSMHDGQHESMILGNGDLYGIVWEKDSDLFIRITKNDIRDARMDVSEVSVLPRIDIINNIITGSKGASPSYQKTYPQPCGAVALRFGSLPVPGSIRAHLDIEKASVDVSSGAGKTTTIRILHDRNVLLINSPNDIILEPVKAETLPDATLGTSDRISLARTTIADKEKSLISEHEQA